MRERLFDALQGGGGRAGRGLRRIGGRRQVRDGAIRGRFPKAGADSSSFVQFWDPDGVGPRTRRESRGSVARGGGRVARVPLGPWPRESWRPIASLLAARALAWRRAVDFSSANPKPKPKPDSRRGANRSIRGRASLWANHAVCCLARFYSRAKKNEATQCPQSSRRPVEPEPRAPGTHGSARPLISRVRVDALASRRTRGPHRRARTRP